MTVYVLFVLGFVLLVKGADFLVRGASAAAKRLGVTELVIGLTVVAFGTSTPELAVNVLAAVRGTGDIAMGNAVGSNIFNILVILGISALIFPLTVTRGTVWREIPFTLLAALVLAAMANDVFLDGSVGSMLSRVDGLVLLCFFAIFMYYVFTIAKARDSSALETHSRPNGSIVKAAGLVVLGLAMLVIGAKWVVDGVVVIAESVGVSRRVIALTIVAAGTSLPELATSAVAAYRRNSDIAVGNIVGSNIFNILLILGVTSVIRPVSIGAGVNVDIAVMTLATVLLFVFMFTGKRRQLDRWEAALMLVLFAGYLTFLLAKG
jgi:cation:H+ antiporter